MMPIDKYRVYDYYNPPEWLDSDWWTDTDNCNHLDNRVHEARLHAAADTAIKACQTLGDAEGFHWITDLGAGDGGLLSLFPDKAPEDPSFRWWGYEVITDSVRYAKEVRRADVRQANVLRDLNKLQLGSVVVMTEMLEHIANPYQFVQRLYDQPYVYSLVASSPHSETREHHEWNHAWVWDRQGYREMFEYAGWNVVDHFDAEWSQVIWVTK